MNIVCWKAAPNGRYSIDIVLGASPVRMMIDTGLVDPIGEVGFEIDPVLFDSLAQSGQLVVSGLRSRLDASGRTSWLKVGLLTAQVLDPLTQTACGPVAQIFALRNHPKVPNRVGLAFFHKLVGCRVVWELDARLWSVEYP